MRPISDAQTEMSFAVSDALVHSACLLLRVIESFRLEKTFKIVESNR